MTYGMIENLHANEGETSSAQEPERLGVALETEDGRHPSRKTQRSRRK